ncbi:MAG: hypothetical protein ACOCRX_07370 [Candidatus Woesearchaeota archaeon]
MATYNILGVKLIGKENSVEFQKVLTKYNHMIMSRFGHHDEKNNDGIVMVLMRDHNDLVNLKDDLKKIDSLKIKEMSL